MGDAQTNRAGPASTTWLTPHFSLEELTDSNTAARKGLDNTPSPRVREALKATAGRLEEVRALLGGKPILISSGYRATAVNAAVGGSRNSAHITGHAVDFTCPGFGTPRQVAVHLAKHLTGFDQLILEYGRWVHIGFGPGQRGEIKTATRSNGGATIYSPGIK